jgi:hypothetical protein
MVIKIKIDEIIEYKNEFQIIISTHSDINEEKYVKQVATEIGAKFKKLSIKIHPDRIGQKKFRDIPYVSQLWFLLTGSNELLQNFRTNFKSYHKSIQEYRSSEHFWNREEDRKNLGLGSVEERIKKIREEEKNDENEKIKKEEEKEKIRKEKSLKRKEEEEKIRKEKSLKRKEEEEKIRKEKSLKRKEEEEKERVRRQDSLNNKILRARQLAEDDKRNKKQKEEEEHRRKTMKRKNDDEEEKNRQDSLNNKILRARQLAEDDKKNKKQNEEEELIRKTTKRKNDDEEEKYRQDSLNNKILRARQLAEDDKKNKKQKKNAMENHESLHRGNEENNGTKMDIDDQYLGTKKKGRRNDHYMTNKTKRQLDRRTEIINNFMKSRTVKRRELIDKIRSRDVKMDVVNQYRLPKSRNRTLKRRSAVDRIRDYFTP